jgi:hypothetical protein
MAINASFTLRRPPLKLLMNVILLHATVVPNPRFREPRGGKLLQCIGSSKIQSGQRLSNQQAGR